MAAGNLHHPESRIFTDEVTGRRVRQVTTHPSIHHHPFFYVPAYDDAMRRLIFVSHRTGRPEIFAELRDSGKLLQVSDHPGLGEWSVHPAHNGRHVYFTDVTGGWRIDLETQREEKIFDFSAERTRDSGMVGAAMGTTALSRDDRWWAVPVKIGKGYRLFVVDTANGAARVILERDSIGHPEFHPDDPMLLRYAALWHERIWAIRRDGTENRLVYRRGDASKEWIVHETWAPGRREILTSNWPHGVVGIDLATGAVRPVARFNAWHPVANRRGTLMVADTTYPDTGIWMFGTAENSPAPEKLCLSSASNGGTHWNTDHCPYDDGPVRVEAPQHTHPHPRFAPDDSVVLFTSDRTGFAQLYECALR